MVKNNVKLKSNSSDIYFKIRYATMLCGLGLPSVNFVPPKALALCLLLDENSAGFLFWSIKISDFLSKPRRIFKFSLAFLIFSALCHAFLHHGHLRVCYANIAS